jgi:small-conductance mechanosensitive channel
VQRLGTRVREGLVDAWQPPQRQPLIWCLIGAGLLLVAGRWLLDRLLVWVAARQMPDGHLRRSALATGVALSSVLIAGLAAQLLRVGLNWNGALDADLDALAGRIVNLVMFAAYVTGLGRALLSVDRPSWRLPALSDLAATRLRVFPWLLGAAALVFGLLDRLTRMLGTSLAVTVTAHGLVALVVSGLIGATLVRLRHARRALISAGKPPVPQPAWVGVLRAGATLGVIISWLGVATGFIALAYFVALQMLWIGVIVATLYLLNHLVHDLFHTLLAPDCPSGKRLQVSFGVGANTLDQAAVVLSGAARLALMLLALAIVLSPFGAGPSELLASVTQSLVERNLPPLAEDDDSQV